MTDQHWPTEHSLVERTPEPRGDHTVKTDAPPRSTGLPVLAGLSGSHACKSKHETLSMSYGCGMERMFLFQELKFEKACGSSSLSTVQRRRAICLPTRFHSLLVFAATLDDGLQLATWNDVS